MLQFGRVAGDGESSVMRQRRPLCAAAGACGSAGICGSDWKFGYCKETSEDAYNFHFIFSIKN